MKHIDEDKKQTVLNYLMISLFWGSLWGISEATLGYMAHLLIKTPIIVGFILFPIAFYFMTQALRYTGKTWVILSTASVASSIKLLDLFLPGLPPIYTLNPAVCILLEALAVMVMVKLSQRRMAGNNENNAGDLKLNFLDVLTASLSWRLGYYFYSFVLYFLSVSPDFIQKASGMLPRFLILEPVITAAIILFFLKMNENRKISFSFFPKQIKPSFAATALIGAILVKFLLAVL